MASKKSSGSNPSTDPGRSPSAAHLRQAIVDKVADTVATKITTAADRQAAKLSQQADRVSAKTEMLSAQAEKLSAHAARTAERLDRLSEHLNSLDVWTRVEPTSRKPRFTREEIAIAAVHIADTEGLDALSMRRLAAELDAGTMTLYHYVRTKDELLTLALDQVMAEVVVPGPLPTDWREAMMVIALSSRDALLRHAWILDVTDEMEFGPNSVRHFEQSLEALASIPASMRDRLDILTTVDEFVFGHCIHLRNAPAPATPHGAAPPIDDRTKRYIATLIETGEFPQLAGWVESEGFDGSWSLLQNHSSDPQRFSRALSRILDGIEAHLDRQFSSGSQPKDPTTGKHPAPTTTASPGVRRTGRQ